MKRKYLILATVVGALFVAMLLFGCSSSEPSPSAADDSSVPAAEEQASTEAANDQAESAAAEEQADDDGELVTIRYGHQGMTVQRELYIAEQEGFFEQNGIKVELSKVPAAEVASAIVGGSLDAGGTSPIFALPAIVQGAKMKAIMSSVEYDTPTSLPWVCVLNDSPVQKPEDLDGLSISGWEKGSNLWLGIQEDYAEYGISFSEYIGAGFGEFQPMLLAGSVEAGIFYPDNYLVQYPDDVRTILPMKSIAKFGSSATHWFSEEFIDEHPEAVEAFVKSLQQARELEKGSRDAILDLTSEFSGKTIDDLNEAFDNGSLQLYADQPQLNVWQLQNEHDAMVKYGLLDAPVDTSVFVDDRFVTPVYEMPEGALDFLEE